eukprot:TRINITY_DN3269_c1_g4_i1.p1 TRINITY_DN3269_c1_g4~~TRINITY_DN3269_c1_g4_i1.p1  ORF type:complete len:330 (+),score=94.02 TRINITY_DN3269_c1_g4_i1:37-990(+)
MNEDEKKKTTTEYQNQDKQSYSKRNNVKSSNLVSPQTLLEYASSITLNLNEDSNLKTPISSNSFNTENEIKISPRSQSKLFYKYTNLKHEYEEAMNSFSLSYNSLAEENAKIIQEKEKEICRLQNLCSVSEIRLKNYINKNNYEKNRLSSRIEEMENELMKRRSFDELSVYSEQIQSNKTDLTGKDLMQQNYDVLTQLCKKIEELELTIVNNKESANQLKAINNNLVEENDKLKKKIFAGKMNFSEEHCNSSKDDDFETINNLKDQISELDDQVKQLKKTENDYLSLKDQHKHLEQKYSDLLTKTENYLIQIGAYSL